MHCAIWFVPLKNANHTFDCVHKKKNFKRQNAVGFWSKPIECADWMRTIVCFIKFNRKYYFKSLRPANYLFDIKFYFDGCATHIRARILPSSVVKNCSSTPNYYCNAVKIIISLNGDDVIKCKTFILKYFMYANEGVLIVSDRRMHSL